MSRTAARGLAFVALVNLALPAHVVAQGSTRDGGIDRPITRDALLAGRFIAFSDKWSSDVSGGDPVVFKADGRIENRRAGLTGTWRVLDDSTVMIGGDRFRNRRRERDLFSPFDTTTGPGGAMRANGLGTRIERASDARTRALMESRLREHATRHWPALSAGPDEWVDSLVVELIDQRSSFGAAAYLVDLWRPADPTNSKPEMAVFHFETAAGECIQTRTPYSLDARGKVARGRATREACRNRVWLARRTSPRPDQETAK